MSRQEIYNPKFLSKEKKAKGSSKLKLAAVIGFRLLICPGDDVAVIFAQAANSTNRDVPVAALIQQEPKVITVFEEKNLKV